MLGWIFTKTKCPKSNEQVELDSVALWTVEWTSRYGDYSSDTRQEFRAFPNKEDALKFKTALDEAFKLVKNSADNWVKIRRN